ncbi:MAG: hypothetical protein ACJKTH_02655 [Patescibacteria group bacterium UBA2163]
MHAIFKATRHRIFLATIVGMLVLFPIGVDAFLDFNGGGFFNPDPGDQGFPNPGGGGPLSISCGATPRTISSGGSVNWFSSVSGGTGSYTYSWSGTNGLSGNASNVFKTYSTVGTKTAQVTVYSGGQTASDTCGTVQVSAPTPSPTVSLSANPTSIAAGNTSTLSWSSSNATSCTGSGFSTGGATSGSRSVSPSSNTTYGIVCSGAGGTVYKAASVSVTQAVATNLSIYPTSIVRGNSATISWSSSNATSCTGSGFSTGGATSGSRSVSPSSSTTYSVTCQNSVSSSSKSRTLTVTTPTPAPTASLSASPSSLTQGQYTTLSWSSSNASSCAGSGFSTSNRTSGSVTISPNSTTNYSVTCYGTGGTASDSSRVTVTTPLPSSCSSGSRQTVSMALYNTNNEASGIWGSASINSSYAPGETIRATGSLWSDDYPRACPSLSINGTSFNLGCQLQLAPSKVLTVGTAPSTPGTYQMWWAVGSTGSYRLDRICPMTYTVVAPAPTTSLSASPSSITRGDNSTLSWSSTNATSCSGNGFNTSNRTSGSVSVSPNSTTNYSVTCTGGGGSRSDSSTVTVTTPTPAPTASLSASPSSLTQGQYTTLSWSSSNASSCAGSGFSTSNRTSGSVTISPNSTTNYSVTCYGTGGTASDSSRVTVTTPLPSSCSSGSRQTVSMALYNTNNEASGIWGSASINSSYAPGETIRATGSLWSDDYPRACPSLSINGTSFNLGCQLQLAPSKVLTVGTAPSTPGTYQMWWAVGSTGSYRLDRICPMTYTVVAPAPTTSLSASPSSITRGDNSTLSWSSTNATSCSGNGFNTSNRTSGSVSVSPNSTTNYSVTCTGGGGSDSDTARVTVNDPPPEPTANISVNPSTIIRGNSSTLSWSSTAASFCTGSGFSTSNRTSGSVSVSPNSTTNYSVTCSGTGGSDSDTARVTVNDPAPTTSLSASPSSITRGDNSTLSWSSTNATSCSGNGFNTSNRTSGSVSVSPNSTTNYSVTCTGGGGSDSDTARVTVNDPPPEPTANISVNPSTIIRGNSSTISWSSEDATGCTGSGFSTSGATSGSRTISPPSSRNYSVTCSGPGGSDSDTAGITVNDPAPTASLSVSPSSITRGETVTLSWSSNNATRCSGDGQDGFFTGGNASGNITIIPTGSKTYTVSCTGPGGSASDGVYVSVSNPAPTASLSASPSSLTQGGNTRLSWNSTNATRCSGDGQDGFYTNARTSGSVTITPSSSKTYTVTCEGYGGEDTDSASVSISTQCSDGIDNDGDGLIDHPNDPGCFAASDNDEYNPPPEASISLSVSPNPARTNETARLSWTARNVENGSCRLTGSNGDSWNLSGTQGSRTSSTLTEEVTYTLRCTDLEDEIVEQQVDVKLTPIFREI